MVAHLIRAMAIQQSLVITIGQCVKGDYFIAKASATISGVAYNTGDWAVYDGGNWAKVDNTDAVMSVNGLSAQSHSMAQILEWVTIRTKVVAVSDLANTINNDTYRRPNLRQEVYQRKPGRLRVVIIQKAKPKAELRPFGCEILKKAPVIDFAVGDTIPMNWGAL